MGNVLLVAEAAGGSLKKPTYSAVTFAKQAQQALAGELHLLVLGQGADKLAKELTGFGATQVWFNEQAGLEHCLADTYANAISQAAKAVNAELVCAAATAAAKDLYPRVAARMGASMASDVLKMESAKVYKRAMWAGNIVATVELTTAQKVVTVRPTEFDAAKPGAAQGDAKPMPITLSPSKATFVSFSEVKSTRPSLSEARIIVSGGRGTKGDFKAVEELADALGAAVGASRAACDAGWVPNDYQVGQTGKIVAPELYIAAGISGAIQHIAGMKGSKTIVAINKDVEAPIFQIADYGLVADLFKALPEMTAAIKAAK